MPKKVLIITYYWPPAGGIAVVRWVKFVKYIRENGWEPVVFTVSNGNYPLIDASLEKDVPEGIQIIKRPIWEPHQLYRFLAKNKKSSGLADIKPKDSASFVEKLSNWVRSNFFIPDARAFWIKPSVKFLKDYLKMNPVDAIVSTGPPHSAHLIALALKKQIGLPWLADFRDPWTTMDYYKELLLTNWADKKHHRLELEVLKTADSVTVIGNGMKVEFEEKSGRSI
ncbi:MAG TPA: glycosyl transferase, partial [Cyclobacteriaceae bacterium]|nr:glycosyl transferase [Cyclobacteriaceae bacterium]